MMAVPFTPVLCSIKMCIRVNQCCCGCTLQTGTRIIGWINLVDKNHDDSSKRDKCTHLILVTIAVYNSLVAQSSV